MTPGDILAMLRRRAVLAALLTLLFAGLLLGGFFVWWRYFPGYRAECLIECVSNAPKESLTLEHKRLLEEEHERFVATQALLLKSPSILEQALRLNAVRETKWYKSNSKDMNPLIELTEDLVAAPVRGTNFLRVALETNNKQDPHVIVDAIVRLWLDTVKTRAAEDFATDLQGARGELEAFDRRIEDKRKQLETIATQLPPGLRQIPAGNLAADRARTTVEQVGRLRLELTQLEQLRSIYNNPSGLAATAEDRALVEQDPQVLGLKQVLLNLEQQYAADLMRYGTNHSVLRRLENQITALKEKLGEDRALKLQEIQSFNREQANNAYLTTQQALFLAEEQLMGEEAVLEDQDRQLSSFRRLETEIVEDTEYRKQLVEYVTSLERVVRQRSAVDINVAQPATEPLQKNSPSLLLIPLALFLSLALGGGVPIGLELLDKSVRTTQEITRFLGLPVLGAVPHTDDEEVAIARPETAVRDAPHSLMAEAFRAIRTNLQFAAPAARLRTLLVTSPRPEDGKTTVACNLAIGLAQSGRRVLLVDANLRRPAIGRALGASKAEGLSNILVGGSTLEACVAKTDVPGLDVLGCGPTSPNPAELFGGEICRSFFEVVVARYDHVIFDTPPVLLATDALVLSSLADGVVLVIRAKECSRGAARRAAMLLGDVNARLYGAVLNAAQVTRGGYFREQLRTHYEYQERPAVRS